MKLSAILFAFFVALLGVMLGACGNDSPVAPVAEQGQAPGTSALKANNIVGVHSATLHICVIATNEAPVHVHRITGEWDEATTSWNSFGGQYDPTILNSFTVATLGYRAVDVTGLVADWVGGVHPNHGLLLDQDSDATPWAKYNSREAANNPPLLEVCYETAEDGIVCETVVSIADTYIFQYFPDAVHGSGIALNTGWTPPSTLEKQSLVRFDLPEIPDEPGDGCTLTPGYWQTHSEYGPAPYDATWAELADGADTPFFLSGKSYYQVLWTPPAGGHAYYILAFQYIAAELNRFADADFTAAQEAFAAATEIFENYTPDQVKAFARPQRARLIALAETLDDYNNGLIGPGHCGD